MKFNACGCCCHEARDGHSKFMIGVNVPRDCKDKSTVTVKVVNPLEKRKTQLPANSPLNYCSSLIEHHRIKSSNSSVLSKLFIRKIPARHGNARKDQKK
jgi:hypothetical protein